VFEEVSYHLTPIVHFASLDNSLTYFFLFDFVHTASVLSFSYKVRLQIELLTLKSRLIQLQVLSALKQVAKREIQDHLSSVLVPIGGR